MVSKELIQISQIKGWLLFLSKRCLWVYFIVVFILAYYAGKPDPVNTVVNRLNYLRLSEIYISESLSKDQKMSKREYCSAIKYYKELVEFIGPKDYLFANMGFCWYRIGDYNKALEMYDQAIRLNPAIYTYYADKGMIYLALGKPQEAISWLEQSLSKIALSTQHYDRYLQSLPEPYRQYAMINLNILTVRLKNDLLFLKQKLLDLHMASVNEKMNDIAVSPEKMPLHLDTFLGRISTDIAVLEKVYDGP
ncbi:MAG: tetratricopeptide repeat protein [Candidatus Omnitrophica bacterium]|nr:tetratricopeptide repeat protein [Candidatus Omnitrophota bacterium]